MKDTKRARKDARQKRIGRVLRYLDSQAAWLTAASHYSEPGYTGGEPIVFANWNSQRAYLPDVDRLHPRNLRVAPDGIEDILMERAGRVLEKLGVALEWNDEWVTCDYCDGAIRTQPDSYAWLPSYVVFDECEIYCRHCLVECSGGMTEEYLEQYLLNNSNHADLFGFDFAAHGFTEDSSYRIRTWEADRSLVETIVARFDRDTTDFALGITRDGSFALNLTVWTRPANCEEGETE